MAPSPQPTTQSGPEMTEITPPAPTHPSNGSPFALPPSNQLPPPQRTYLTPSPDPSLPPRRFHNASSPHLPRPHPPSPLRPLSHPAAPPHHQQPQYAPSIYSDYGRRSSTPVSNWDPRGDDSLYTSYEVPVLGDLERALRNGSLDGSRSQNGSPAGSLYSGVGNNGGSSMGKSSSGTVMGSSGMVDNNGSGEGLVGGKRIRDEEMGLKPPPRRMPMERSVTMGSEMEEWMRDDDDEKLPWFRKPRFLAGLVFLVFAIIAISVAMGIVYG